MKNLTVLLAVTVLTTSTVGCGCCRRLRDTICRGAYCGTPNVVSPTPVAVPAPAATPAPAPVVVPQHIAPQAQPVYVPQPTVTQCVPCDPCCVPYCPCDPCDPCGSAGYGYGYGYGGPVIQSAPVEGDVVESPWATSDQGTSPTPAAPPTMRDEDPGPREGPST